MNELEGFDCLDCGVNTMKIGEYYMVNNDLWESAVPGREGMLCIACLEGRLDRTLTVEDFTDAPVNKGIFPQSERVQNRLNIVGGLRDTRVS